MRKSVLIVGANSYIGKKIKPWLEKEPDVFDVDVASARNDEWKNIDFTKYSVIINVSGIAHIKISADMEPLFYKVNTQLAVDICKKAKESGCSQYIYMSSMNVYGDTSDVINENMPPMPKNFYGKSKLMADQQIAELGTELFHTVSIRPPVVYGKGCKGNFPRLAKLAKFTPIFPNYKNIRSMIYIDNLCELIRLIILNNCSGIFHPQNKELTSTVEMVEIMSKAYGHKIWMTKIFNCLISITVDKIHIVNRMFANDSYSPSISNVFNYDYCVVSTEESIKRSL